MMSLFFSLTILFLKQYSMFNMKKHYGAKRKLTTHQQTREQVTSGTKQSLSFQILLLKKFKQ